MKQCCDHSPHEVSVDWPVVCALNGAVAVVPAHKGTPEALRAAQLVGDAGTGRLQRTLPRAPATAPSRDPPCPSHPVVTGVHSHVPLP